MLQLLSSSPTPLPLSGILPYELGRSELVASRISNNVPVDAVPPRLQVLLLLEHSPIWHVDVLPCVDTQNWSGINTAWCDLLVAAELAVHTDGVGNWHVGNGLLAEVVGGVVCVWDSGLSVHVLGLAAPVCAWVWGAGDVCGEDGEFALLGLDEPDVAWTEHGVGGGDHLAAESLDGGEGLLEALLEGLWDWDSFVGEGGEEEVVVVCHGGVVEKGSHGWLAGVLDQEVLSGAGVVLGGACINVSF